MKKTFPAVLSSLQEMINFINHQALFTGFDPQTRARIELVAEEALANIILYAYPSQTQGFIEIECEEISLPKKGLKIALSDRGKAFDPIAKSKKIDTKAPLEKRTYGGYGIFFVLKIMDEVFYERKGNNNVLTLIKYMR